MTTPIQSKNTNAFYVPAAISFAVALGGQILGEVYMPVDGWMRAFMALGTVFLVTTAFTLAKCVRDAQENLAVVSRLDQARLERLLGEFDPYEIPHLAKAAARDHQQCQQAPLPPPDYVPNPLTV